MTERYQYDDAYVVVCDSNLFQYHEDPEEDEAYARLVAYGKWH